MGLNWRMVMPRKIGASLGSKLLTIAAIILSVMIGGAFCVSQLARQDAAMAQAERELSSKADLLAGHMARIFEMAGGNLRAVAKVRDVSVSNAFTAQQMHAALAAVHANSPVFISLIWTDAAGERIATSFSANPLEANLADREHFTVPKADRTFNDRPFIGRLTCSPEAPAFRMRVRHQETDDEEEQIYRGTDHRRSA